MIVRMYYVFVTYLSNLWYQHKTSSIYIWSSTFLLSASHENPSFLDDEVGWNNQMIENIGSASGILVKINTAIPVWSTPNQRLAVTCIDIPMLKLICCFNDHNFIQLFSSSLTEKSRKFVNCFTFQKKAKKNFTFKTRKRKLI